MRMQRFSHFYENVDVLRETGGKHTVFLEASFLTHTHAKHDSECKHVPERQRERLSGETAQKRLDVPMWWGQVT